MCTCDRTAEENGAEVAEMGLLVEIQQQYWNGRIVGKEQYSQLTPERGDHIRIVTLNFCHHGYHIHMITYIQHVHALSTQS